MFQPDDLEVTSGRDEDVDFSNYRFQCCHLEAFHACLQGTDGVNLCNHDTCTATSHGMGTALAHIAEAADQGTLASNHDIGGSHDRIWKRVSAPIDIVKLRLGHAIIDINCWEQQLSFGCHLFQAMDTGSCLFAHTLALRCHSGILGLVCGDGILQELQDALELGIIGAVGVGQTAILCKLFLELLTFMDQECCITSVVHELVATILARHCHHLLCAPPVLWKRLTLPRKNCGCASLSNRSRSMILSAEDVARTPTHCSTQFGQSLDEHSCLDRHVQRAIDIKAFERLARTELLASCHETRHLNLCQIKLLTTELGQAHIFHLGISHV